MISLLVNRKKLDDSTSRAPTSKVKKSKTGASGYTTHRNLKKESRCKSINLTHSFVEVTKGILQNFSKRQGNFRLLTRGSCRDHQSINRMIQNLDLLSGCSPLQQQDILLRRIVVAIYYTSLNHLETEVKKQGQLTGIISYIRRLVIPHLLGEPLDQGQNRHHLDCLQGI